MKGPDILDDLRVASPCPASWNAMKGDDRARFCGLCEKHVYQVAAMTRDEVVALVRRTEGDFCGRLYHRRDGTVLTADCPVGKKQFAAGRLHRVLTYGVLGLGFLTTGAFLKAASQRNLSWPPTGSGVTFGDWKDWALQTLGLGPARNSVAGGIRMGECLPILDPIPGDPTAGCGTDSAADN